MRNQTTIGSKEVSADISDDFIDYFEDEEVEKGSDKAEACVSDEEDDEEGGENEYVKDEFVVSDSEVDSEDDFTVERRKAKKERRLMRKNHANLTNQTSHRRVLKKV